MSLEEVKNWVEPNMGISETKVISQRQGIRRMQTRRVLSFRDKKPRPGYRNRWATMAEGEIERINGMG